MRRSSRTQPKSAAASALADLAERKAGGKSRLADYQVEEEKDVFETVDEQTYAAIAAQKRKEARDFIADRDDDGMDDDADDYAMEREFELEDEMSVVRANQEGRKRKRVSAAPVRKKKAVARRVPSAFFEAFRTNAPAGKDAEEEIKGVLNTEMLDQEYERHIKSNKANRKKKKAAVQRAIGDLLFGTTAAPSNDILLPQPEDDDDNYAAPPPSVLDPVVKPHTAADKPKVNVKQTPIDAAYLEDSMDCDALVAAADAAEKSRADQKKPPVLPPRRSAVERPAPNIPSTVNDRPAVAPAGPLARLPNGDVMMYWTDAHEVRVNGGEHLYLFGKVATGNVDSGSYASLCVQVHGMERTLFVLPRKRKADGTGKETGDEVKILPDVHSEISSVLMGRSQGGKGGAWGTKGNSNLPTAVKAKIAKRACPFGNHDAPREPTDYLKVKFPFANTNRLTPESAGESFSRVFGTKTSAAESLCLKRRLKGPGWIRLSGAKPMNNKVSHAKYALYISSPEDLHVPMEWSGKEPPTVSALSLNVKTMLNARNGSPEIVMLSGVFIKAIPLSGPVPEGTLEPGGQLGTRDFVLIRPPDGQSIPFGFSDRVRSVLARGGGVEVAANEPALLNNFLSKLMRLDPDVILGHDLMGYGLDVLLSRMSARRCREWSRLGRLIQRRDLTQVVKNNSSSSWFKSEAIAGRLLVDTYMHAKDLLMKEKDYSLSALSQSVLAHSESGGATVALPPSTDVSKVPQAYKSTDTLCRLVTECSLEARTAARLAAHLSILPLTLQLTSISGNIWSHTLRGARAERIEYLLCHEFKLIGAKETGSSGKAGDVTAKLLLPDKLSKTERTRLAEAHEAKKALENDAVEVVEIEGEDGPRTGGYGVTPKSAAASTKPKNSRRKPQYSGGLVLEPKKGFYDRYVLQLDFNSLYPSIIQEYNICFTTLPLGENAAVCSSAGVSKAVESPEQATTVNDGGMMALPNRNLMEGVLPRVLRRLVEQRRQVKGLLKEERKRAGKETLRAQQLDIRQLAIKLTANSLYGCLGFEGSRFFARPLAEMVTCQGRDTLQKTVNLARDSFNAQVIYGDTDSLFVYTGLEDISGVRKLGAELKRDVNKKYRTLEIEIDAIYKKMLLLKKKKYAALKVVDPTNPDKVVREVKGLDLVRHDWCDLSHEASEYFLSEIFKGQSENIEEAIGNVTTFLSNLADNVNNNKNALAKYVITRSLTKRPQDYPDGVSLPHVAVALRLTKKLNRSIKPGDYIKYVVCLPPGDAKYESGSKGIAQRSYHPDEVNNPESKLVVDAKYYLENQVLPPIIRLCDPIESVEISRIATSLGLDGRRYERKEYSEGMDGSMLALGPQSASEKFQNVDTVSIPCLKCGHVTELEGVKFRATGKAVKSSGLECFKCHTRFPQTLLINSITLSLRKWKRKYYTAPLVLGGDDGTRRRETRNISMGGNATQIRREFDEAWLYKQLRYVRYLVDVEAVWRQIPRHEDMPNPMSRVDLAMYKELLQTVDQAFDANAYRYVDLSQFLTPLGIS
eukprot:GFKZ01002578.1.p1 GENE.GFKZ01002578.1~~GFKZ01002578.1.p1  ORF type:complete len:1531 (+),score=264.94 GFKZ01002578.1:285-4877(+)